MAEYPAMPLFTDAYLGDTHHLTLEESGAYLKLLMIAWRTPGCCLPDDDKRLATMLGVTIKRWRERLRPVIEPFWIVEDGKWTQKKQQKVRKKVKKSEKLPSNSRSLMICIISPRMRLTSDSPISCTSSGVSCVVV